MACDILGGDQGEEPGKEGSNGRCVARTGMGLVLARWLGGCAKVVGCQWVQSVQCLGCLRGLLVKGS